VRHINPYTGKPDHPRSTYRHPDPATGLVNRRLGQRREAGVCWCCASPAPVRPCSYWVSGSTYLLCAQCEREQAVVKPDPRHD
jgi:hypothetical protein